MSQKNIISLEPYFSLAQRVVNPRGGVTMGMVCGSRCSGVFIAANTSCGHFTALLKGLQTGLCHGKGRLVLPGSLRQSKRFSVAYGG